MSKLVFLMSVPLASPAWSQDHSGFYLGGDVSVFETRYENLTIEGDGTALGIHAGYRYASIAPSLLREKVLQRQSMVGPTMDP